MSTLRKIFLKAIPGHFKSLSKNSSSFSTTSSEQDTQINQAVDNKINQFEKKVKEFYEEPVKPKNPHQDPPTPSDHRSRSQVSLPQPTNPKLESIKSKNKKRLSLADKRYFLHSAASSVVPSPTTACPSSRPMSTEIPSGIGFSNLKHSETLVVEDGNLDSHGSDTSTSIVLNENQRLTVQHNHYKKACGDSLVHPSVIEHLGKSEKILEIATGNGVWLQDLRNSSLVPSTSILHASDLFNPTQNLPVGINAFASHDVTIPFPKEGIPSIDLELNLNPIQKELKSLEDSCLGLPGRKTSNGNQEVDRIGQHGTYDFINSRLLVFALSKEEWVSTVENLMDLLKPEGLLHLSEVDTLAIPSHPELPHPSIQRTNRIATKVMSSFKKEANSINNLPSLLKSSGFTSIKSTSQLIPFGKSAIESGNFNEIESELGSKTALGAIGALKKPFLALGGEEGCESGEEFDGFLKDLEKEIKEVGIWFKFIMVVGQKPFENTRK